MSSVLRLPAPKTWARKRGATEGSQVASLSVMWYSQNSEFIGVPWKVTHCSSDPTLTRYCNMPVNWYWRRIFIASIYVYTVIWWSLQVINDSPHSQSCRRSVTEIARHGLSSPPFHELFFSEYSWTTRRSGDVYTVYWQCRYDDVDWT